MTKFPKCEAYGLNTLADLEAHKVEQALTQAESKGIQLGKDIGIRVGFTQGAKAERERIYELVNKVWGFCSTEHKTCCFRCWLKSQLKEVD